MKFITIDCFKCCNCKTEENIVKHHVVPRSKGGRFMVPVCQTCHDLIHSCNKRGISVSELTKRGLEKARERGVKLGGPNFRYALQQAKKKIAERSNDHAMSVLPVIQEARLNGRKTLRDIAEFLMSKNILTPCGRTLWTAQTVRRTILRLKSLDISVKRF